MMERFLETASTMDEIKAGESIESSEGVPLPMPTDQEGQGEEEAERSSQGPKTKKSRRSIQNLDHAVVRADS
jgi:hypothetical protein